MRILKHLSAALAAIALAATAQAATTVLTFDDIVSIEDGYGGITGWEAVGRLDGDPAGDTLFFGREGSLSFAQEVTLLGMDFVSWTAMELGGFRLFHEGQPVYEYREIDSSSIEPIWREVSYRQPIDRIEFFGSSDGFLLDNLTFTVANPVPEPGQAALFLAGFAVMGVVMRRRRIN